MSTHLNIAAIARRTGVAPDTLRKWEHRYGVLQPERTAGGQRRYSQQDVARVEWLRDRLGEGWRIGEAARVLRETPVTAPSDPGELRDALVIAAEAAETATVGALLDQALAVLPLEQALDEVMAPALRAVGEAWARGDLSVASEHAVSARIRARLDQLMVDGRAALRGVAVLACAPGEQHDLGLLMIAVLLRADGWAVEYLGQSTPVVEAVELSQAIAARVLCFSAAREETLRGLQAEVEAIEWEAPPIVVGGHGVRASLDGGRATLVGRASLAEAVRAIRSAAG